MKSEDLHAPGTASLSALLALPWCCITPALLSALGVSVAGLSWLVGPQNLRFFLALSLGAVTWSLYLAVVKRRGSLIYRALSFALALSAVGLWSWRLSL